MPTVTIELVVPISTTALCLIAAGTAVALATLTFAVVGLYCEVKRIKEAMVAWKKKTTGLFQDV